MKRPIGRRADARFEAFALFAPAPEHAPSSNWEHRGELFETELRVDLGRGYTGHLLWEWLVPGDYPRGQTENAHFLRWQLNYELE